MGALTTIARRPAQGRVVYPPVLMLDQEANLAFGLPAGRDAMHLLDEGLACVWGMDFNEDMVRSRLADHEIGSVSIANLCGRSRNRYGCGARRDVVRAQPLIVRVDKFATPILCRLANPLDREKTTNLSGVGLLLQSCLQDVVRG